MPDYRIMYIILLDLNVEAGLLHDIIDVWQELHTGCKDLLAMQPTEYSQ